MSWMTWLTISFRLVPTFGQDMIQKFSTNVSDLSKLAARDFEDILQASFYLKNILVQSFKSDQCAIPIFNGLLPEPHNAIVLNLLFELATWHAFGKLRMHTETTLFHFRNSTTCLGRALRIFSQDCCTKFKTYDLPHETAAHAQHKAAQGTKEAAKPTGNMTQSCKPHIFNMSTYKLHALSDYVTSIWLYGTTDNYSTQVVSEAS